MPPKANAREYPALAREYAARHGNTIALSVVVFLAYFITARVGLSIHPVNTFVTLIWPPTGIALAALVLFGHRLSPSIALAAFIVNLSIGAAPLVALAIALGNTVGPLLGAYVLTEHIGFRPPILRLRDNVGIVGIALGASIITATVGTLSLWVGGSVAIGTFATTWTTWWIGDTLGILLCAPLIFKWIYWPRWQRTRLQYVELWAAILTVAGSSVLIFWIPQTQFAYYLFIPLTWVALRTGPRGTTLAIFVAAVIAIAGTLLGGGPFAGQKLIFLQVFVGTVSALYLIFAAVVEERRQALVTLESQINDLENALERISSEDEAKKEFLAVLAHELRNPLAAVLSSVELLKMQGGSDPDTPAQIQAIGEHVHVMAGLLDDLLDISRISKKKFKLEKEIVAIGPVVDRSVRTAQRLIRNLGHTLSVTKQEEDLFVEADPVRLEQIIVNLLNNAAKYTEPNGSIELIARREGSMTVIRVRDSGIGIPRTMLTRIFDPFFQIDRGKPTTEGLGIGLALTSQLVKMHGGTIEAQSQGEGRGSEFIVRLPSFSAPKKTQTHASGKSPALRSVKHPLRILVVDDNRAAADGLGKLLSLRGHTTKVAYTGSEAIESAEEFKPHVIVLDIGLPDMNGYNVARILRQKDFGGTLVALTGYGQESDKELAFEAGFQFHLTKPVGLKDIEAVLSKLPQPV